MDTNSIIQAIDKEIAALQSARAILAKGMSGQNGTSASAESGAKKKRRLTPEGRARIAEAVKRRWAKQRKATKAA